MGKTKSFLTVFSMFVIVPAIGVMALWHGRCDETIVATSASPDSKYSAQISYKDCGTSQPVATLVRVINAATQKVSENLLLTEGKFDVAAAWPDATTLTLTVPKDAKVVYRRHSWEAVNLTFAARD